MCWLWLVIACTLGDSDPAGTPAAAVVQTIGGAKGEAEAVAALAARAEVLAEELRTGPRPREQVQAELEATVSELEARSAALDAQLNNVRDALTAHE